MYRIIYLSAAVKQLTVKEISSLLEKSRVNNLQKNITGLLLYIDGSFLQILEGEKKTVIELYEKIKQDCIHKRIICVFNNQTEKRQFPHWSMGFCSTTYLNLKKISEFENFEKDFLLNINDKTVLTFVDTFIKSQREKIKYI